MANDVPLLCEAVPRSINVASRSLMMVLGFGAFMVGLSPRLALLALLEVPLTITARKVYDARYQVMVGTGWRSGDGMVGRGSGRWDGGHGNGNGMGWDSGDGMVGWGQGDGVVGMGTGWDKGDGIADGDWRDGMEGM